MQLFDFQDRTKLNFNHLLNDLETHFWTELLTRVALSRRWYSGEHRFLPGSLPGFDSRRTHFLTCLKVNHK